MSITLYMAQKLKKRSSRNWKLWSVSAKKSLMLLTNKSSCDLICCLTFIFLVIVNKVSINIHVRTTLIHQLQSGLTLRVEFDHNQQKHPMRINFLYGIYNTMYYTFYYYLQIICYTSFISVEFIISICIYTCIRCFLDSRLLNIY